MLGELFEQVVDWVRLVPRWARWGAVGLVAAVGLLAAVRHMGGGGRGEATAARGRSAVPIGSGDVAP